MKRILLSTTLASLCLQGSFLLAQPAPPTAPLPPLPPLEKGGGKLESRVFLGVETGPVPSVLSAQLDLPEGFGLVAEYVVPESPAAAAGLQKNDVLKLLDDQKLLDPGQLAKLVRGCTEGQEITLTVLRKGAELKVTAKLAKKEMPKEADWMEEVRKWKDFQPDKMPAMRELHDNLQKMKGELQKLGRDGLSMSRIEMGNASLICEDETGTLEVRSKDGQKRLFASKPDGTVIFDGPINTPEQRKAIPPEVLKRLEKLEGEKLPEPPQPPEVPEIPEVPKIEGNKTSQVFSHPKHTAKTRYALALNLGGNRNRSLSLQWGRLFSLDVV